MTLADRLDAEATALAAESIAKLYENPFWDARFGTRGRSAQPASPSA